MRSGCSAAVQRQHFIPRGQAEQAVEGTARDMKGACRGPARVPQWLQELMAASTASQTSRRFSTTYAHVQLSLAAMARTPDPLANSACMLGNASYRSNARHQLSRSLR